MVMEYAGKGAYHGHTTDSHAELGATARTGASPRPRRTAVCTRALCCTAEDRRWDAGACRRPAGPLEAARSCYRLCLADPLPGRWSCRADGPPPRRLPPEPTATTPRRATAGSQRGIG